MNDTINERLREPEENKILFELFEQKLLQYCILPTRTKVYFFWFNIFTCGPTSIQIRSRLIDAIMSYTKHNMTLFISRKDVYFDGADQ